MLLLSSIRVRECKIQRATSIRVRLILKILNRFQWAVLQIKQILRLETETAILDRLGKLPADLKAAYDEIYDKVKALHKNDRALADNAFKWVAAACEPLTSEELLPVIRLDSQQKAYYLSDEISESQLLHLCNNLLVLDSKLEVWRFSHLSVVEYFETNHWTLPKAHAHCASVCLKVLNSRPSKFREGSTIYDEVWQDFNPEYSLKLYAWRYWTTHVEVQEAEEVDPVLEHHLKSFLGSPENSSLQYREWYIKFGQIYKYSESSELIHDLAPETVAFFAMCRFSFWDILLDWWEDSDLDLSQRNQDGRNALEIAAKHGRKQNCENLVELGVDVNLTPTLTKNVDFESHGGSALAEAAHEGYTEIVEFLLEKAEADVNLPLPGRFGSALIAAATSRHINTVKYLVMDAGASINQQEQGGKYGSALAAAVRAARGDIETVQFLVQAGADVNTQLQFGDYGSALATAAASTFGTTKTVQFLVQAGADINLQLQAGYYGSALAAAAGSYGEIETIEFLVQAGADVNLQLQAGNYGNALAAAVAHGKPNNVEYLVLSGKADVNQQIRHGKYGGSALAVAAYWGRKSCAETLLKVGAEVNLKIDNGPFRTALQASRADISEEDLEDSPYWTTGMKEIDRKAKMEEFLLLHGAIEEG